MIVLDVHALLLEGHHLLSQDVVAPRLRLKGCNLALELVDDKVLLGALALGVLEVLKWSLERAYVGHS